MLGCALIVGFAALAEGPVEKVVEDAAAVTGAAFAIPHNSNGSNSLRVPKVKLLRSAHIISLPLST